MWGRSSKPSESDATSATWTYVVTDDPLGNPGDRLASELGKRWRSEVPRIE